MPKRARKKGAIEHDPYIVSGVIKGSHEGLPVKAIAEKLKVRETMVTRIRMRLGLTDMLRGVTSKKVYEGVTIRCAKCSSSLRTGGKNVQEAWATLLEHGWKQRKVTGFQGSEDEWFCSDC